MDKRKVNGGGAAEDLDERASKRRKLPNVSRLSSCSSEVAIVCDGNCVFGTLAMVRRVLKRRAEGSWHCTTVETSAFVQDGKADSQQGPR